MIIASILKNYKCYKGINVIPLSNGIPNYLNIIIGNNGVGKSAVLEGLDTLFNDAHWIVNSEVKSKDDSQVAAFFLWEKQFIDKVFDAKDTSIISEISEWFWTAATSVVYRGYENLFEIRDGHSSFRNTHYLVFIGKAKNQKSFNFLTFDKKVKESISIDVKSIDQTIHNLLQKLLDLHAYIYIPIETSVSSFVKLQNQSMQVLMDKRIKDEITAKLIERRISRKIPRETKLSLMDMINEVLEAYVKTVESDVQKEYAGYSYKPRPNQVSKLTANQVADSVIETYYSRRVFKKDGKTIEDLSSGEKRIILIDIISAFIKKNNPSRELIVAIDEPECSLHISRCYDQFIKISKIATDYNHQIFVTTHWYGSLPVLKTGGLTHIDERRICTYNEIKNYFEKRGDLPNDIQLKGYFDLTSSLLYAFRNSSQTMILVEGYEDKRYIEYYLSDLNLNVVPVGGCSNVKKIYNYLYTPLSDKEMQLIGGNKKIICMIDTDITCPTIGMESDVSTLILTQRRLHQEGSEEPHIIKGDDNKKNPTEIEDVLEPKLFYEALFEVIHVSGSTEEQDAFHHFGFNDSARVSRIKGDYSILKPITLASDIAKDKEIICNFVDAHKEDIALKYISMPKTGCVPNWLVELRTLCKKDLLHR